MTHAHLRALAAALGAALLSCALAASAHAFALTEVTVRPTAPSNGGPLPPAGPSAAAAHPDLQVGIAFDDRGNGSADSVERLALDLAPGIVANVANVPVCEHFDPSADGVTAGCEDAIVGVATTSATAFIGIALPPLPTLPLPGNLPVTLSGPIYRIPSPDPSRYPAAFGIDIGPAGASEVLAGAIRRVKLVSPITVVPETLGLRATLSDLPDEASVAGLTTASVHIDDLTQTLYGYTGAGRPFFTNPTACIPAPVAVRAVSHGGASDEASASYTPTDCENVPFETTLRTEADPSTADATSAISFEVRPGVRDVPRVSSHVRNTTVVAAPGVLLNPALAARLEACTDAGFQLHNTAVPADCPPSAEVGTIDFESPILGNFRGTVHFGTQTPADRLRLFLDVPLFGAHIKVAATVNPDVETGQITTRFTDLPQIAFARFKLTFRGGARSALVTPTGCGEHVSTATVTPWSGGPATTAAAAFTTTDCVRRFAPSMAASVSDPHAGAPTAFTLAFERPDRTVPVGRVAFDLPPGLTGSLALDGLTRCPLADAAAARCPESSRIGGVRAVVGSGGEPPTLPGAVYLTEPRIAGDPAGLSISVPARLGPVDAGTVTVAQRLVLGGDGGLDVISDPIPALQFGIPLAIRWLTVTIDRAGFMRNPTSCGEQPAAGTFTPLDGGPAATASSAIAVVGCETLPFAPRISGVVGGRGLTRRLAHPAFTTVISQRDGESAMRRAVVTLPPSLSTNLRTAARACPPDVFAADSRGCAAAARVATARAESPLTAAPLTGPVWLVRQPQGLPRLLVQLRGEVALDLEGVVTIGRGGVVVTTFDAIPDLPLARFELRFRGGRDGVLTAVRELCAGTHRMTAAFDGHGGRSVASRPRLRVNGCPPPTPRVAAALRFRDGRGTLALRARVPRGGRPLTALRVALPRSLSLADADLAARAGGRPLPAWATWTGARAFAVLVPGRGTTTGVTARITGVTARSEATARALAHGRGSPRLAVRTVQRGGQRAGARVRLRLR